MKIVKTFSVMISILTILFAIGERFSWWDYLTGREYAVEGLERLRSAEGYPKSWIYRDKKEDKKIFFSLERRINKYSKETKLRQIVKNNIHPTIITVGGNPLIIYGLKPGMMNRVYSSVHPVLYLYFPEKQREGKGKALQVCTLGELQRWLEQEKNALRFWVITILFGSLTVIISIYGIGKTS